MSPCLYSNSIECLQISLLRGGVCTCKCVCPFVCVRGRADANGEMSCFSLRTVCAPYEPVYTLDKPSVNAQSRTK